MLSCPENCIDWTLVSQPTGGCDEQSYRKRTLSRLAFMACNIALPDPFTSQNTTGLFLPIGDSPIVLSNPLRNFTPGDPETEEIVVHDCAPALQVVNRRVFNFEDAIKVEVPAVGPNPANPFYDYDFWKDKLVHRLQLRYAFVFCNGDVVFARNDDGSLMEATFQIYLSYQRLANNGGTLEFKKGSLSFQGDPLLFAKPDFNLVDFGIDV